MKEKKFPGWLRFVVLCNDAPIASFHTKAQADGFGGNRAAKYPKNAYRWEANE